jgi:hypothetical protein
VVYSLLDDLKATSRWRRFATATAGISQAIVERFKRPRRPEPEPTPEQTPDAAGD